MACNSRRHIDIISCRVLPVVCAAWMFCACTDDTFDASTGKYSEYVSFMTEVPGGWTDGDEARGAGGRSLHEVDIEKIDDDGGEKPLYLITEVTEASDTVVNVPGSRGVSYNTATIPSVGVSAVCYGDAWPTDSAGLTPNFAYNLRLHKGADSWAPDADNKLRWLGSGRVKFYAYAPYSADFGTGEGKYPGGAVHSAAASGLPSLTFTVSTDDVTKQVDLLEATADCAGNHNSSVSLKFTHALTAVTFKTGDKMLSGRITKITLSGIHFKGTSVIGSKKWSAVDNASSMEISLDKTVDATDENNPYTPSGKPITSDAMTLFMLPQKLGDDARLTVTFIDGLSDKERTLTASLSGKEWEAGTRVQYSLSTTGIKVDAPVVKFEYTAEKIHYDEYDKTKYTEGKKFIPVSGFLRNVRLTAYADVYQLDEDNNKVSSSAARLKYKIQYSLDGVKWEDVVITDSLPDDDATKPSLLKLQVPAQSQYTRLQEKMTPTAKGKKGPDGSGPYDLSQGGETANCYVIDDYGDYSLPLVYGNARGAGGTDNADAYKGNDNGGVGTKFLRDFVKHDGNPIIGPDIKGACDAVLVWQDQPGLVTDVRLNEAKDALTFRVDKESLNQGNAVVAVRDGEGTIMWSWHIWATYRWKDSGCVTGYVKDAPERADVTEYKFAPCPVGYCDPVLSADSERKLKLKLIYKLADNGKEVEMELGEFIQPPIEASYAGDNPYYQWGRKEPSIGGVWNASTLADGWGKEGDASFIGLDTAKGVRYGQFNMHNKVYYSDLYEYKRAESKVPIEQAIKEPYHHFMHDRVTKSNQSPEDEPHTHWGGANDDTTTRMYNAWNSANDFDASNTGTDSNGQPTAMTDFTSSVKEAYMSVKKTVYDPSPVGYHIPSSGAFMSLYGAVHGTKKLVDTEFATESDRNEKQTACDVEKVKYSGTVVGWNIKLYDSGGNKGATLYIPATGLRDWGETETCPGLAKFPSGTNPAHAQLAWIATSSHLSTQCSLFYIDCRAEGKTASDGKAMSNHNSISILTHSNNSYGFTVFPVKDN